MEVVMRKMVAVVERSKKVIKRGKWEYQSVNEEEEEEKEEDKNGDSKAVGGFSSRRRGGIFQKFIH